MILEYWKTDGSLVFHEVKVFMVRADRSLSVRDCDENLLSINDFSIYTRLRLLSDEGKILHTVRDDVAGVNTTKPVEKSVKHVFDGENVVQIKDHLDPEDRS